MPSNTIKTLFLGGNFAEDIRPSGFINKLHSELVKDPRLDITFQNGGSFDDLNGHLNRVKEYQLILWFVNVPNSYSKMVKQIKVINPKAILVTSKNNLTGQYGYPELVARILNVKANLSLVFTYGTDGKVTGTLLDPLGNSFLTKSPSPSEIVTAMVGRSLELLDFTRSSSKSVGPALEVPPEAQFFSIAHKFAEVFHTLIHTVDTERFLGNLSFRCMNGFPSFVKDGIVYVSRRNIDKRLIGAEGFVGVSLGTGTGEAVQYYGENKPSVDTPVQIALYKLFPQIRYMMHSHVYVDGAPFTNDKVPCGALEEIQSILDVVGDPSQVTTLAINLYGHGSIVMTNDLRYFNVVHYKSRALPETDWRKDS